MCFLGRNWSGLMARPITVGRRQAVNFMAGTFGLNRLVRLWSYIPPTLVLSILLAGSPAWFAGCGELEPMVEPEVVDLQLTVDTLKAQVRDSQRTMAELRAELDARRQELADTHVAKAQLEGRVREAERRVAEARHVISLQREELVAARAERERISRSSAQLHSQMRKLQKHLPKSDPMEQTNAEIAPSSAGPSAAKAQRTIETSAVVPSSEKVSAVPASMVGASSVRTGSADDIVRHASTKAVSVRAGDTLWSLARKYGVDVQELRTLNHLSDNRIAAGQAIWVPAPSTEKDHVSELAR